jgi:1,4-dihydroxy-2-naphthoate octaprenyltransferase
MATDHSQSIPPTGSESRLAIWLAATRPRTLPAAVAPVLVGCALAWRAGGFQPAAALLCLAFAVLIQIGTNFANDYFDFVQGADTAARVGPRRAVAAGLIAPAVMRRVMAATFAVAFVTGLGLLPYGGPWLLVIGVASVLCGIAYTGGPWPLGYHGLGDVFVFIFFGLVAVGTTAFVQTGQLTRDALLAAVPIGLLTANILVVNNYRDVDTDRVAGKRTLVVRFGRPFARAQFNLSLLAAFVVPWMLTAPNRRGWAALPCLLLPMAWRHSARLRRETEPAAQIQLLGDTGKLLALYALLLAASLMLGR